MQADRPGKPTQPPTLVAALASEPKLAAKHPSLGDFLRSRWADAAFMTAAGMAEATGLPTTTLLGCWCFSAIRTSVVCAPLCSRRSYRAEGQGTIPLQAQATLANDLAPSGRPA